MFTRSVLVLALSCLAAGCGGKPATGAALGPPEAKAWISDIRAAFLNNQASANDRIKNKVLDVEGAVIGVEDHPDGAVAVLAEHAGIGPERLGKVLMASREEGKKVRAGTRAVFRCRCLGLAPNGLVLFEQGILLEQKAWVLEIPDR